MLRENKQIKPGSRDATIAASKKSLVPHALMRRRSSACGAPNTLKSWHGTLIGAAVSMTARLDRNKLQRSSAQQRHIPEDPAPGHPLNFSNGAGPPTIPHRQLPAVTGFCFCPDRRHLLISSPFPKERHSSIPSILWLRPAACIPIPSFAFVPPLSRHVVKNNLEMSVCFVDPCTAISLRFASGAGVQNNAGVLMRPASNL